MIDGKTIAVVVPAFNEERLIVEVVSRIPCFVDSIIVVDDASEDDTIAKLESRVLREGLEVHRHEVNKGVGGAIVTGYKIAVQNDIDVVAVMAGDAQMDPSDLWSVVAPVVAGEADYSKGNRLSYPGAASLMPFFRFMGNHALSFLTRLTSGYRDIRDSQCGYTAISSAVLKRMEIGTLYARYGFPNDLLAHLHTVGARIEQVIVRPVYGDEVSGISWFTALVKVPLVLLRSYFLRKKRESKTSQALLEPARRS